MRPDRDAARPPRSWLTPGLVFPAGLEAGLVGAFVVVGVYLLRDAWIGQAMHTPSVLGAFLLEGVEAARAVRTDPTAAVAYHVVHFAVWVVVGFVASALVQRAAERRELAWLPLAGLALAVLALVVIDGAVIETRLARPHLWAGGLAGVAAMGAFLLWLHPDALRNLRSST
ncbi:MAG: hypothetical protein QNK04_28825 [Myxococcota bacterium]|nr:hypothetical protein [Myxococcota bacterium]